MTTVAIPADCRECGACCAYKPGWVEVSQDDLARLGDPTLVTIGGYNGNPFSMKTKGVQHQCIALDGDVGISVNCTVYDKRPDICRAVERGSPICLFSLGFHDIAPSDW